MTRARFALAALVVAAVVAGAFVWRARDRPAARDRAAPVSASTAARPSTATSTAASTARTAAAVAIPAPATSASASAPTDTAGTASYAVPAGPAPPPLTPTTPEAPRGPAYPESLTDEEERAMRVRHLVEVRAVVADADARLAAGDEDGGKLQAFRDEEATRLDELEAWAADHGVDAAELDRARAQVDHQRAAAIVEPPRP